MAPRQVTGRKPWAFIGGVTGATNVVAQPSETILIGAGAIETIADFSLTDDALDLTSLLHGVLLTHDLSNLGAYVRVTGQTPDQGGTDTTLSIQGPAVRPRLC